MISHDRAFLDAVVTSTLVFEGNGAVSEYAGGYSDWVRQRPGGVGMWTSEDRPDGSPAKVVAKGGRVHPN